MTRNERRPAFPPEAVADTATIAKALAHPIRVRIVDAFTAHETICAAELAREWNVPVSNVAYHVRRLAALGVVRLVDHVMRRGAVEHRYELVPIVLGGHVAAVEHDEADPRLATVLAQAEVVQTSVTVRSR
jgi:DNA-binding transcriptional ArsR family regulator